MEPIYKKIHRYIRRYYILIFKRKYIHESIAKRKGSCNKCGCCVDRLFPCKYFEAETKSCLKYPKFRGFPFTCKLYQIDEKDKSEFSKEHCGFYWENQ